MPHWGGLIPREEFPGREPWRQTVKPTYCPGKKIGNILKFFPYPAQHTHIPLLVTSARTSDPAVLVSCCCCCVLRGGRGWPRLGRNRLANSLGVSSSVPVVVDECLPRSPYLAAASCLRRSSLYLATRSARVSKYDGAVSDARTTPFSCPFLTVVAPLGVASELCRWERSVVLARCCR